MKRKIVIASLLVVIISCTGIYLVKELKPVEKVAESALVNYGSSILNVDIKVGSVSIDFESGTASIENLLIANPDGFNTEYAINANQVTLKLDLESIMTDTVRLEEIRILEPEFIYEYGSSGSNFDKLGNNALEYVKKQSGNFEARAGAILLVDNINIDNPSLRVSHQLLKGKTIKLNLPDMQLKSPAEITQDILSGIKRGAGMAAASLSLGKSFLQNQTALVVDETEATEENLDWIFQ